MIYSYIMDNFIFIKSKKWMVFVLIVMTTITFSWPMAVLAGTDAGTIQRTLPKPEPKIPTFETVEPEVQDKAVDKGPTVNITTFVFKGNTLISTVELQALLASYLDLPISLTQLEDIRVKVGELYRQKGFWATAIYEDQDLSTQTLIVTIYEGRVGSIGVETDSVGDGDALRFPEGRIKDFVRRQQAEGEPINITELDYSIADLESIPGISATVLLDRGENVGETDIIVQATNTPYLNGFFSFDNTGSRATGYEQGILNLNINSPFKQGEQFNVMHLKSTGVDYFGAGVSYPLLANGTTMTYSFTTLQYELGYPLKDLGGSGNASTNSLALSKKLMRSDSFELTGNINYAYQTYYNETGAEVVSSDKNIKGWTVDLSMFSQDQWFGGGLWINSLGYKVAKLDQGNYEADAATSKTSGHYSKVNLNLLRIQQLTQKDALWLTMNGQYAVDSNMDSAEKMSLGGATGVRGYPTAEANGDSGILIQTEIKHTFTDKVQASIFYDWGQIYQYKYRWTDWNSADTSIPNQYQLKGAGFSLTWVPVELLEVKLTGARTIGTNKGAASNGDDGDSTNKNSRLWATLTRTF